MTEKYITHEGGQWVGHSQSTGAILGRHKTKEDALRQLRAIEAAKRAAERAGKKNE